MKEQLFSICEQKTKCQDCHWPQYPESCPCETVEVIHIFDEELELIARDIYGNRHQRSSTDLLYGS